MMRALCELDLVGSSAWVTLNLPNKEGTNAGRSVQLGDHMRLAFVGCRNIAGRITASVFQLFCRYALGREGPFEGYCSEGVEHYKFTVRVIARQCNS
jgi:hypothetical protein